MNCSFVHFFFSAENFCFRFCDHRKFYILSNSALRYISRNRWRCFYIFLRFFRLSISRFPLCRSPQNCIFSRTLIEKLCQIDSGVPRLVSASVFPDFYLSCIYYTRKRLYALMCMSMKLTKICFTQYTLKKYGYMS